MKFKAFIYILVMSIMLVACTQKNGQEPTKNVEASIENLELSGEIVDGVRVINIEAFQFGFSPENIVVGKGERVKLLLQTRDVTHGILAKDLGIDAKIPPDETAIVEFTAEKEGTYPFRCNVRCGSGHANMKGLIIVK